MDEKTLSHAGVKGMKWGVRRYQNADGSLTDAGKKRYARDTKDLSDKKKKKYEPDVNKWVTEYISNTKRLTDESSQLASKLKNVNDASIKNTSKPRMDLSNMSDQEMRSQINRELLERQYNDIFAPKKVSKGKQFVSGLLNGTVATLGIASSALGIALAIRELRG